MFTNWVFPMCCCCCCCFQCSFFCIPRWFKANYLSLANICMFVEYIIWVLEWKRFAKVENRYPQQSTMIHGEYVSQKNAKWKKTRTMLSNSFQLNGYALDTHITYSFWFVCASPTPLFSLIFVFLLSFAIHTIFTIEIGFTLHRTSN